MKKIKKFFRHSVFAKFARPGEINEGLQALTFWELLGVIICSLALFVCAFIMVSTVIKKQTITIPTHGGSINEGIVGNPNLFNPLLSVRDEDQEIVTLVFAGLLKRDNNTYVNDLAEGLTRSKDAKTVTVKIKPDLKFHNGDTLNADDVVFTIDMAKDPRVKSPLKVLWDSVTVTKKDDLTIVFSLKQPYGFFDDMLTIGIISDDIFKGQPREEFPTLKEHQKPIGAGPYKFNTVKTNNEKVIEISLRRFRKYDPKPYIKNIHISYFDDEVSLDRAFRRGDINIASGVSPKSTLGQNTAVIVSDLNRVFAIFINRKNVNYSTKTIEALNQLVPRELIVEESLMSLGAPIMSPYPTKKDSIANVKERVDKALGLLEADGWKHLTDGTYAKNDKGGQKILSVTITSPDTDELRLVGDKINTAFRDVGIQTQITYIDPESFTDKVIRPRDFDFVLFGQALHTPADLYAFWHSSQKNDPGLNIGAYSNKSVDLKLESLLRETDATKQDKIINEINNLIKADTGAIFIFTPKYIMLSDTKANIILPNTINYSKDRYQKIHLWSVEKERILKFLKQ